MNPYEILSISPNASEVEIMLAYNLLKKECHDIAKEQKLNAAYKKAMENIGIDPEVSPYWLLGIPEDADCQTITWAYHESMRRYNGTIMKDLIKSTYEEAIKNLTLKKNNVVIDINDDKNTYELKNEELRSFQSITVSGAEVCNILNKIETYINQNGENKFLLDIRACLLKYYLKVKPYINSHNLYKLTAIEYKELHDFIYDMYTYNIEFTKKLIATFFSSFQNNLFRLLKYTVEYKELAEGLEYELDIMRTLMQLDCLIIPLASASDKIYQENPEVKEYGNGYLPVNWEIDKFYNDMPRSDEYLDSAELVSKCLNGAVDKFVLSPEKKQKYYAMQMLACGYVLDDVAKMSGLSKKELKNLLPDVDEIYIIPKGYDLDLRREKRN